MHIGRFLIAILVAAAISATAARAADNNSYRVTILVSNEAGEAPVIDPKLVNAWGIAASATSPWWVADNGTGYSTIYTGAGAKLSREVVVPGAPPGIVSYSGSQFLLAPGTPARFIFASEDGTISGWSGALPDPTHAVVAFSDPESVYKGLAVHGNTLYTTDFAECAVERLNGTFTEFEIAGGFEDTTIPPNYCPFGIQAIGNSIFVTYALRDGTEDVAGTSHGFVRQFDAHMLMLGRPEAKADTLRDDLGAEFHFCRMSRDSVFAISYKGKSHRGTSFQIAGGLNWFLGWSELFA